MPKDFTKGVPDGTEKVRRNRGKENIVNEMVSDDGPVPTYLAIVGTHDAKTSHRDSGNDTSFDACAHSLGKYKAGTGVGEKGPNGSGAWHLGEGADEWTSGGRHHGGKD